MYIYCLNNFIFSHLGSLPAVSINASIIPSAVELSWNSYSLPGITVSSYIVCVRSNESSSVCDQEVELSPSVNMYNLTGLTGPDLYYVSVIAVTQLGQTSTSPSLGVNVDGTILPAVENLSANPISHSEISYSWSPYQLSGSGTVNSFLLCLRLDPSEGCNIVREIGGTETSYTVSSLNANTIYYARILARTSVGDSPSSEDVQAMTRENGE